MGIFPASFEKDRKVFDRAPARCPVFGGNPLNEAVVDQVPREYAPVTGSPANLRESIAALLRILRIPTVGPQALDEATHAGCCPRDWIALLRAEPERLFYDFQATRSTDPGPRPADERAHLYIDQSIVSRPCTQSPVSFDGAHVIRHEVDRGQLLQNLDFVSCALRFGQFAQQFESILQNGCSFPRDITTSRRFGLKLQVLGRAGPI